MAVLIRVAHQDQFTCYFGEPGQQPFRDLGNRKALCTLTYKMAFLPQAAKTLCGTL